MTFGIKEKLNKYVVQQKFAKSVTKVFVQINKNVDKIRVK